MAKKNGNKPKTGKVLDLNTKLLIGIQDELRAVVSILQGHTSVLEDHSKKLTAVERAVKELARETRRWVAHFDRDYLRLANDFDGIRARVEKCERQLARG